MKIREESDVLLGNLCRLLFVLRRACLVGEVKRADLISAFKVSGTTATADLENAANKWPGYLQYQPSRGVSVRAFAPPPTESSSSALMDLLQRGASMQELGLTKYEPVFVQTAPRFVYQGPENRQQVLLLIKACIARTVLEIEYVGMRQGEVKKARLVLALGLELLGQQWRLIACDIDAKTRMVAKEQKVFVLARILNAQTCLSLHGKRLKSTDGAKLDVKAITINAVERDYQVQPNRLFSDDQLVALTNEFALTRRGSSYVIRMPARNLLEFQRDYCTKANVNLDNQELSAYISPIFESIQAYDPA